MSAKFLLTEKSAVKQFNRLPLKLHERIISALDKIKQNPLAGVKLHGELGDYYKFRVGDYRIVYKFDSKKSIVQIVKIEHRQGVYK